MTEDDSAGDYPSNTAFISIEMDILRGARKRGPMETDEVSSEELYRRLDSLDIEDRLSIIQELGLTLSEEYYHHFVDALVTTLSGGTLDVTGWTRLAVKAALVVSSERDLPVSFRYEDRTISPVSYPKDGILLDMFVDSIITGKWG
ncbi:MAG: hypothetical protein ACFFED_16035 [Candidatus Thorarchaeota archaeon]